MLGWHILHIFVRSSRRRALFGPPWGRWQPVQIIRPAGVRGKAAGMFTIDPVFTSRYFSALRVWDLWVRWQPLQRLKAGPRSIPFSSLAWAKWHWRQFFPTGGWEEAQGVFLGPSPGSSWQ